MASKFVPSQEDIRHLEREKRRAEKRCDICSTETTTTCSLCNAVYYCSVECQSKGWKAHKERCAKSDSKNQQPSEEGFLERRKKMILAAYGLIGRSVPGLSEEEWEIIHECYLHKIAFYSVKCENAGFGSATYIDYIVIIRWEPPDKIGESELMYKDVELEGPTPSDSEDEIDQ